MIKQVRPILSFPGRYQRSTAASATSPEDCSRNDMIIIPKSQQLVWNRRAFGTSHCSVAGFACAEGVRLADERSEELCEAKSQEPERRNPLPRFVVPRSTKHDNIDYAVNKSGKTCLSPETIITNFSAITALRFRPVLPFPFLDLPQTFLITGFKTLIRRLVITFTQQ